MRRWLFCSILAVGVASALSPSAEAREVSAHLAPPMPAHSTMFLKWMWIGSVSRGITAMSEAFSRLGSPKDF